MRRQEATGVEGRKSEQPWGSVSASVSRGTWLDSLPWVFTHLLVLTFRYFFCLLYFVSEWMTDEGH